MKIYPTTTVTTRVNANRLPKGSESLATVTEAFHSFNIRYDEEIRDLWPEFGGGSGCCHVQRKHGERPEHSPFQGGAQSRSCRFPRREMCHLDRYPSNEGAECARDGFSNSRSRGAPLFRA